MLEGLDKIDWASLEHAYGPATDVPELIRGLLTANAEVREEVLMSLYSTIWHQGTIYEATAHAVPFLYELLEADEVSDKWEIVLLLASIAEGTPAVDFDANRPDEVAFWESVFAKEGEGKVLAAELERELDHVEAAKRAVVRQIDILYPYLRDPEPYVRRIIAKMIGELPAILARVRPDLEAALENETDEEVREVLIQILRQNADSES